MKQIIAPDRMKYIRGAKDKNTCVFCEALKKIDSQENLIVFRGENVFVILNLYPYTSGHLLILPFEHTAEFHNLSIECRNEMMETMNFAVKVLKNVYNPVGFNLGANLGSAAGAGIVDHLHFHVVPRWEGDANFISVIGKTKVLPQTLAESYKEISLNWQSLISKDSK